jgi:hypothetical protein
MITCGVTDREDRPLGIRECNLPRLSLLLRKATVTENDNA